MDSHSSLSAPCYFAFTTRHFTYMDKRKSTISVLVQQFSMNLNIEIKKINKTGHEKEKHCTWMQRVS